MFADRLYISTKKGGNLMSVKPYGVLFKTYFKLEGGIGLIQDYLVVLRRVGEWIG